MLQNSLDFSILLLSRATALVEVSSLESCSVFIYCLRDNIRNHVNYLSRDHIITTAYISLARTNNITREY